MRLSVTRALMSAPAFSSRSIASIACACRSPGGGTVPPTGSMALRNEPVMPAAAMRGVIREDVGDVHFGAGLQQRFERFGVVSQRGDHHGAGAAAEHVVRETSSTVAIGAHAGELVIGVDAHFQQSADDIHRCDFAGEAAARRAARNCSRPGREFMSTAT